MSKVLLLKAVSRTRELEPLLLQAGLEVTAASTMVQARKLLLDVDFSLVIIETPLSDGSGREMAIMAANNPGLDVILFAAASQVESLSYSLERYGIHVLGRNASAQEISALLRILKVSQVRIARLEEKNARLLKRLSEERVLCEAKCILALKAGLDEQSAHHYLEKKAMDERISLTDAARIVRREEDN